MRSESPAAISLRQEYPTAPPQSALRDLIRSSTWNSGSDQRPISILPSAQDRQSYGAARSPTGPGGNAILKAMSNMTRIPTENPVGSQIRGQTASTGWQDTFLLRHTGADDRTLRQAGLSCLSYGNADTPRQTRIPGFRYRTLSLRPSLMFQSGPNPYLSSERY